jgi:ABC-type bacteriocin/lantibiotic exporter with double-glycine peptidase domain
MNRSEPPAWLIASPAACACTGRAAAGLLPPPARAVAALPPRPPTGGVTRDVERGGSGISDLLDWTLYTILPTLLEITLVTGVLVYEVTTTGSRLITFGALVAYVAFTVLDHRVAHALLPRLERADTEGQHRAVDSLLNYETVKYFGNEEHEARRYDENLQRYENAVRQERRPRWRCSTSARARSSPRGVALMWRAAAASSPAR